MKLSTFAKKYNLDYHKLFRVKHGAVTRDQAIQCVFGELDIINSKESKEGEPNISFIAQERICIAYESKGVSYCYTLYQLQEIEAYLLQQHIPYYVRQIQDYWLVKYDKEAL